jgi:hypothetical protein
MALKQCPECGRDVSTEAASCPGCGHPIRPVASEFRAFRKRGLLTSVIICSVGIPVLVVGIAGGNPVFLIAGLVGLAGFLVGGVVLLRLHAQDR